METEDESITASNRALLITIAAIAVIVLGGIFLLFYSTILYHEQHVIAVARPDFESDSVVPRHITSDDFKEHPALEELIVKRKLVLVSYGLFWDVLLRIDPRSHYHTAGQKGESRYSKTRISWDEKNILIHNYTWSEYNGTVSNIGQSA
ncbi:hypothetical protein [Methanogenium cariaci]|jgi:hypothetical protein